MIPYKRYKCKYFWTLSPKRFCFVTFRCSWRRSLLAQKLVGRTSYVLRTLLLSLLLSSSSSSSSSSSFYCSSHLCFPANFFAGAQSRAEQSIAEQSRAQHSTAQHSTAQHSTAQQSTAQHSKAKHSITHSTA